MGMDSEQTWLTYAQAAPRVKKSEHTIQIWRREGLVMRWQVIDGQRTRVVELNELLKFWRERMQSSPVHYYRMRKQAIENGMPLLPMPERFKEMRRRASIASAETRRAAGTHLTQERPSDGRTEPENGTPAPTVDPLATMKVRGAPEYRALTDGLRTYTPSCAGMDEFTAGRVSPEATERMAGICAGCPLLEQCRAFATASKPTAGFWAGSTR